MLDLISCFINYSNIKTVKAKI